MNIVSSHQSLHETGSVKCDDPAALPSSAVKHWRKFVCWIH